MKITLEFNNVEAFFTDLPKFAALIGHAGQFAEFDHVGQGDGLKAPKLPTVSKTEDGFRVEGTKTQLEKVEAADKVARATNEATGKAQEPAEAPTPEKSAPVEETASAAPAVKPAADAIDATTLRGALMKLTRKGHKSDVRRIFDKFGAADFPALEKMPEHFAEAYELAMDKVREYGLDKDKEA